MKKLVKNAIIYILLISLIALSACSKKSGDSNDGNINDTSQTNQADNTLPASEEVSEPATSSAPEIKAVFRDDLESLFTNMSFATSLRKPGENNPLITQDYGADPFAMVYGDRVYVYMTQDVLMYDKDKNIAENNYSLINKLRCISSADMVNWTDHGNIHIGGIKGVSFWANNSWAPSAVWKKIDGKDRFFIYFSNGAGGIGVLTADSPTGPYRDALGKALITRETPNCADVIWLFDPAAFVDDDGKAYLYFGGGVPEDNAEAPKTARVIQLGEDMISTVGDAVVIDAPYLFEDSGINKIGDTYYYSYCTNFRDRRGSTAPIVPPAGEIAYMTSDSPLGPWTYQNAILKNPGYYFGTGGNNHHSMVSFKDRWYMFYHAFLLQDANKIKGGYRSTNADEVTVNVDGSIQPITGSRAGVKQTEDLNPYEKHLATTMSDNAGIKVVEADKKTYKDPIIVSLGELEDGDWIKLSGVDFGTEGPASFTVRYSSKGGQGAIKLVSDSLDGEAIAYAEINDTQDYNSFTEITVATQNITGVHDIYFIFAGSNYYINEWCFNK